MEEPPVRHRWIARTLVVLAALAAFLAIFALWANRQILNTENWTQASSKLLATPVIRDRVSGFLVDELYDNVDVAGEIKAALPPRAQALAGPAAGALRPLAERGTRELLARPRGQQAWENANRAAHLLLLRVLAGGGSTLSTEKGVVALDLKQLLLETEARVGVGGRVAARLPADAAQITVLRSNQLKSAQDAVRILKALPIVLVGLSLVLFGIALAVAPRWRRKTVRAYGIGFIAAGAAALVVTAMLGDAVVDSLARTQAARAPVVETWSIATSLLHQAAGATIAYGVFMVLGAVLAGPSLAATAIRRTCAPVLREPLLAYGALAVFLAVVVFWWAPTPAARNPVLALLLCALVAAGFEGLRRQTAREFPDADFGASQQRARERLAGAAHALRHRTTSGMQTVVSKASPAHASDPGNGGAAPTPDQQRLAQLERLSRLRESGALDEDEFRAEKARLLAPGVVAG